MIIFSSTVFNQLSQSQIIDQLENMYKSKICRWFLKPHISINCQIIYVSNNLLLLNDFAKYVNVCGAIMKNATQTDSMNPYFLLFFSILDSRKQLFSCPLSYIQLIYKFKITQHIVRTAQVTLQNQEPKRSKSMEDLNSKLNVSEI